MTENRLAVRRVPTDSLKIDDKNSRAHGDRNIEAIAASLKKFGQAEPLVVQKSTRKVIGGNGRLVVMRSLGWTECDIVEVDVDDATATALGLALNKTAELAEWDEKILAENLRLLVEQKFDMPATGFAMEEWKPLVEAAEFALEHGGGAVEDPGALEPPREAVSRRGDLWLLGAHRLLCGDSTDGADVAIVMNGEKALLVSTDPPYLVDYTGADRPGDSGKDWSNDYKEIEIKDARAFIEHAVEHAVERAAWYIWHAHKRASMIESILEKHDIFVHQQIVWVKPTALHGYSFYPWQHEPCLFGWKRGHKPHHDGDNSHAVTTVWALDWEGSARIIGNEHPTQKPLEVFMRPMRKHTKEGDICFEPFSGSGSQLVAGEKLVRRVYAIEISPNFVDAALRRWEKATGKTATLEATGRSFAETAAERGVSIEEPTAAKAGEPAVPADNPA